VCIYILYREIDGQGYEGDGSERARASERGCLGSQRERERERERERAKRHTEGRLCERG
jgi:hypothetical protein